MKCPKCNSNKVRGVDNQPIYHPLKSECEEQDYLIGLDTEIYVSIVCDECNHRFEDNFPIVYTYSTGDKERLNIILDSLEPTSDLYKSLKKVIKSLGHVKNNDDICIQPIKRDTMNEEFKYDVKEVLKSVEVIESSKELTAELRKEFGTEFNMIKACIKDNFVKPEAIALISRIAPICYKINGTVFLKGETKGEHDLIGDDMDFQPVTELYDMTQEIATGDSYSIYVSNTDYFELATPEEIIEVKTFLCNLYK